MVARQNRQFIVSAGKQGPTGVSGASLQLVTWSTSGTTSRGTNNRVIGDNVTLRLPVGAANGEHWQFSAQQAYTGFNLNGNGATVDGISGDNPFPVTPCSGELEFNEAENNWFIFSFYAGQNPA